jgi:two-component system, LytTR family, response regulator
MKNGLTKKFSISNGNETIFISYNDITFIEADGNYSMIHLSDGKKHISVKKIKEFESLLSDEMFFRVHHSFIVSLLFVNKLHNNEQYTLELSDGAMIPISRRKKATFLAKFHKI